MWWFKEKVNEPVLRPVLLNEFERKILFNLCQKQKSHEKARGADKLVALYGNLQERLS